MSLTIFKCIEKLEEIDFFREKMAISNRLVIAFFSLETSAFEELGSEFINFACNCIINTLRLIVYLTGFSI